MRHDASPIPDFPAASTPGTSLNKWLGRPSTNTEISWCSSPAPPSISDAVVGEILGGAEMHPGEDYAAGCSRPEAERRRTSAKRVSISVNRKISRGNLAAHSNSIHPVATHRRPAAWPSSIYQAIKVSNVTGCRYRRYPSIDQSNAASGVTHLK